MAVQSFGSYEDAVRLVHFAHDNQVDKAGAPYVEHVLRVPVRARALGASDEVATAAVLHDVLEDTVFTAQHLLELGFSDRVIEVITAVTRQPGVPDQTYYAGIKADPDALLVKAADLADNTDPGRTQLLSPDSQERLGKKYEAARAALGL